MLSGAVVNPGIGAMLGRGDLFGPFGSPDLLVNQDPYTAQMAGLGSNTGSGISTGRISAGVLLVLTVGLVAFYFWTRSHQA